MYQQLYMIYQILAEDLADGLTFVTSGQRTQRSPACHTLGPGCTVMQLGSITRVIRPFKPDGWFKIQKNYLINSHEGRDRFLESLAQLWPRVVAVGRDSLPLQHRAHRSFDIHMAHLGGGGDSAGECTDQLIGFYTSRFNFWLKLEVDGRVRGRLMKPFGSKIAVLSEEHVQKAKLLNWMTPEVKLERPRT